MELTGKVILDDKTLCQLKEEVREEVVQKMVETGAYRHEVIQFMESCTVDTYIDIIKTTIATKLEQASGGRRGRYTRLSAINNILEI